MTLLLADIAHARSGDKGDHADIGLFAWEREGWAVIQAQVTAERLAAHFSHWLGSDDPSRVRVFPLPRLMALKIVLDGALGGGAARNLRSDNLGKTFAAVLLRLPLAVPEATARQLVEAARREIEASF
jgi:hypothetical protein